MIKKCSIYSIIICTIFLTIIFIPLTFVKAESIWTKEKNLVNIYFFHSNTCPHCIEEEKLLTKLEKKYSNIKIYRYETHEERTKQILENVSNIYNIKTNAVPITIIGEEIYIGYSENISKLKFIQTIEYYSKYSYQDKLGENIGITDLPFYKIEENIEPLEDFMKSHGNYTILGIIETKDLDTNLIATITGALSGLNPLYLLSVIIIFIYLKKYIGGRKNQILLLVFYLITNFLLFTTSIINQKFYTLAIQILLLIIFTYGLVNYYRNKKRQSISLSLLIIISIIIQCLSNFFYNNYTKIFLNIEKIYLLDGINNIIYYINYFISTFLIQFIIVLTLIIFTNKLINKYS